MDVYPYVNADPTFLNLCRNLYYQHIYTRFQGGPTVEQSPEGCHNHYELFNYIQSADTPINLELPHQGLWEIINEFIYQIQAYCQFRIKLPMKLEQGTPEWPGRA